MAAIASVSIPTVTGMTKQQFEQLARFFTSMAKKIRESGSTIPDDSTFDWFWVADEPEA